MIVGGLVVVAGVVVELARTMKGQQEGGRQGGHGVWPELSIRMMASTRVDIQGPLLLLLRVNPPSSLFFSSLLLLPWLPVRGLARLTSSCQSLVCCTHHNTHTQTHTHTVVLCILRSSMRNDAKRRGSDLRACGSSPKPTRAHLPGLEGYIVK